MSETQKALGQKFRCQLFGHDFEGGTRIYSAGQITGHTEGPLPKPTLRYCRRCNVKEEK